MLFVILEEESHHNLFEYNISWILEDVYLNPSLEKPYMFWDHYGYFLAKRIFSTSGCWIIYIPITIWSGQHDAWLQ